MIGNDHRAAAGRLVVLHALHLDAVEQAEKLAGKICQGFLGQEEADPDGRHRIGKAQAEEQAARRDELQEDHRGHGGGNHEDRVDQVIGGNDARALGRRGAGLHDGIERHGIDAAEEGGEKQVEGDAPTGPAGKEHADAVERGASQIGVDLASGEIEVNEEYRHHDGGYGHVFCRNLAFQQQVGDHRAQADADGEGGDEGVCDILVGEQDILGENRELHEEHGAHEPEPRGADDRPEHVVALAGVAHKFRGLPGNVPVDLEIGRGGRGGRHAGGGVPGDNREEDQRAREDLPAARVDDEKAAEHGAEENGDKGPHFDHGIAGDDLVLLQVLRQDSVFYGSEKGRKTAGEEQHHEVEVWVVEPQCPGPESHGADFGELYALGDESLVELVGELAGDGRKEKIGQDEQGGSGLDEKRGVPAMVYGEIEGDEDGDGIAQAVVVEGANPLGHEERQEAPGGEE